MAISSSLLYLGRRFRISFSNTTTSSMAIRRVVLVACGSFNPPTNAHFRMAELAKEELRLHNVQVVDAVFSPVSSAYTHKNLESDEHRVTMLQLGTAASDFMRVSRWEIERLRWSRTAEVLHHHREEARRRYNDPDIECMLLCGADLFEGFTTILPDGSHLWAPADVAEICQDFGVVVQKRSGSNPEGTLQALDGSKVLIVEERAFPNNLSSTLLREAIKDGRSIRYLTPDPVVDYILANRLYGAAAGTTNGHSNGVPNDRNGHNGLSNGLNGDSNDHHNPTH